jgi:RES domain-containing protein
VRFQGTCYRAHDPKWSFLPLSGAGAALRGGRFNPRGVEALYLSVSVTTALLEANQGFAFKVQPYVICAYDVDCADVADLTTEAGRSAHGADPAEMACAWFSDISRGREPPSWLIAKRLIARGHAGILTPSYAPGASEQDRNLVLWRWGPDLPYQVEVYDPSGRLRKNQLSWS